MSLNAAAPARKPSRAGLYGPFIVAAILAILWSGVWFWARGEAERRLDAAAAGLRSEGYVVSWSDRRLHGYPFRLDIDFTDLKLAEPSGWAVSAPTLKTEAYAWAPTHWIAYAPQGGTFVRPTGGLVVVGAQDLRAQVDDWSASPPSIVVEGEGLTFTPAPGARPFFVSAAQKLLIGTRAGPDDQGDIYLRLDGARAELSGLIGRIAEGGPVSLTGNVIFSHASAATGRDWPSIVRAWSYAGGTLQVQQLTLAAGEALLDARAGDLRIDGDGRLDGSLTATLREAPHALAAMSQAGAVDPQAARSAAANAGDASPHAVLDFRDGRTRLGSVVIGPAPKVF
jgi:hypothetical protein